MRRLGFSVVFLLASGCGLVLDNSPPDLELDADVPVACRAAGDCPRDPCNGAPSCIGGECVPGEPMDCSSLDLGVCVVGVCSEGVCVPERKAYRCDDGVECTVDECGEDGECISKPDDAACDDGVPCTKDACRPGNDVGAVSGCVHEPDDTRCGILSDSCLSLVCTGRINSNSDPETGCAAVVLPEACPEDAYCSLESQRCEEHTKGCEKHEDCDDGNPCTNDACFDQVCRHSATVCGTSINPCLEAVCSVDDGEAICDYRPIPTPGCVASAPF